jgi:putative SOS response-associated peptidase YedK
MDFPILYQDQTGQRRLRVMKWGLIPAFTKKGAKLDYFRMFNARYATTSSHIINIIFLEFLRSETVESKYSFRKLIYSQRCVVILNGYYEWKLVQGQKQPYYVTTKSHMPLKVAAIFDIFESGREGEVEGENLYSFTMLTCPAHDSISWLHNRQPLILSDTQVEEWIDTNLPPNASIVHRAGGSPALEESHDGGESGEESNEEQSSDSKHLSYLPADIISYTVTPNMTSPTYQDADSCAPFTPRLSRSITSFFKQ